ncbi:MAG TPA: hypothetical protein VGQ20_06720 [Acidimicrobiales bacterium]|jgi:5'-methylthioadenosine nucleosidase|nr:hypothetical protein [Acidimicrobiales bacterium]
MRRIAVVMAMRAEAAPLLAALRAEPVAKPDIAAGLPSAWYEAHRGDVLVTVAINGVDPRHGVDAIGSQPAALNTWVTLTNRPSDLVISAGTAGGWASRGSKIGDVYVSKDRVVYHDRRIALPGFDAYGIGSFPTVDASSLAAELGLKEAIVTTGNSLDESEDDRRMIAATGAAVKDMEAAAVADVAEHLGVPMLAVKAITDLVDLPVDTVEQFTRNLRLATARLCDATLAVLDWCERREVSDSGGWR